MTDSGKGRSGISLRLLFAASLSIFAGILAEPAAKAQNTSGAIPPAPQGDHGHPAWQIEAFAAGGFVPSYTTLIPMTPVAAAYFQMQLDFLNAGLEAGRMVTALHGPGLLRGRGEAAVEIVPFWLANYPKQPITVYYTNNQPPSHFTFPALRRYGATITPVLYRWNFMKQEASRVSPWAQLGGGLLWTNHKFPIVPLTTENTSVINFTLQVGAGVNISIKRNRSLDFAVKAVHISNASLGDNNPGLNQTLQFSAGYSWWK